MSIGKNNLILIGDSSIGFGVACATQLSQFGLEVITLDRNVNKLYEIALMKRPSMILVDTFYTNHEHLNFISKIRDIENYTPKIIVAEFYKTDEEINILNAQKIDFLAKFPVNVVSLCDSILKIAEQINQIAPIDQTVLIETTKIIPSILPTEIQEDLEIIVTDVILLLGIPAHVKGYQYIRCAIINCIETPNMLNSVTKVLYPTVADEFQTSPSRVERAIRHAIEIAWDRGDIETLNSYFGYTVNNQRGKPTNSEFIAMISDKIRLKYKHVINKNSNT